jgi:hypothetical protein
MALSNFELRQATKDHFSQFFIQLSKMGSLQRASIQPFSKGHRVSTGIFNPLMNGIFQDGPLGNNAEREIESHLNYFKKQELPFCWWLHDELQSDSLISKLRSRGLKPFGKMIGVAVSLDNIKTDTKASHVVIRRVTTAHEVIDWVKILCAVFDYRSNEGHLLSNFLLNSINSSESSFQHYLAYLDGMPAGVSTLAMTQFNGKKIAGLWFGGVLPNARKHGLGTAMAKYRIEEGKRLGADIVTSYLMPDGMARGYCELLGLKPVWELFPHISGHN